MIEVREDWTVHFPYSPRAVAGIKRVGGAKFVPKDKGGPHWTVPPTLDSYKLLREQFGRDIDFAKPVMQELKRARRRQKYLQKLAAADDGELELLPELNPELYEFIAARPYQKADIKFMAEAANPLNFNEPGTGKTVETLGAIYESGLDTAPTLVIAPLTALGPTWRTSIHRWVPGTPVLARSPGEGHTAAHVRFELQQVMGEDQPYYLVLNPEAIKQRKDGTSMFPEVYDIQWGTVVIDEFHRMGLGNPKTLFTKSIKKLKADKKILLSGTPIGGRPLKLFYALNFLYPELFTSKWTFANNWLQIFNNGYGQEIGDVLTWRRDEFNEMTSEYMVRRIKTEIMEWLPAKQYIDVYVEMEGEQAKQYDEWEANTELEIEEEHLSATSILAVYTRLRQFASARQDVEYLPDETFTLTPTEDSCKLPALEEILAERGILDSEGTDKVVVFSQFTRMINMVSDWLSAKGVDHGVITGQVKVDQREEYVDDFQDPAGIRVMLMNTQAGGVSITLDAADTVVFLDETWNPDDQTQAEDRVHRGTKTSQVNVYRIRTEGTIEERIAKGNLTKESINERVLNFRSA